MTDITKRLAVDTSTKALEQDRKPDKYDDIANAAIRASSHPDVQALYREFLRLGDEKRAQAGKASGWQPIETCPFDTDVLLFWRSDMPVDVGIRNDTDGYFSFQRANDGMDEYDATPALWMPLPDLPEQST